MVMERASCQTTSCVNLIGFNEEDLVGQIRQQVEQAIDGAIECQGIRSNSPGQEIVEASGHQGGKLERIPRDFRVHNF